MIVGLARSLARNSTQIGQNRPALTRSARVWECRVLPLRKGTAGEQIGSASLNLAVACTGQGKLDIPCFDQLMDEIEHSRNLLDFVDYDPLGRGCSRRDSFKVTASHETADKALISSSFSAGYKMGARFAFNRLRSFPRYMTCDTFSPKRLALFWQSWLS